MLLLSFMKQVWSSELLTRSFHGLCPSNKRAINLLSSLKCHPHIIQLIYLTLLCLKQSKGMNPPPSLLLPQHTFQSISVILLLFPSNSNPSTPWHTFKHWPWPLLSRTRVYWREKPGRRCSSASWPVHNLTLSGDTQFPQHEAAATLRDQLDQTLVSTFH